MFTPGFGLPDEVVIEKKGKGDSFVESTGANVRISNIKFIQHDAIEGILCECTGLFVFCLTLGLCGQAVNVHCVTLLDL